MATFPTGYRGVQASPLPYGTFTPSRAPFMGYGISPGVVGSRGAVGLSGVSVYIDLPRLGRALGDVDLRRSPGVARAINRGVDRVYTRLKRMIAKWTGLKVGVVAAGMIKRGAHPGNLTGVVIIRGKHHKIDAQFKARWGGPSTPGGTHTGWNNPQLARRSFMVDGVLKTRTTEKRFPIKSLYGPNPAREVIRHRDEVEAMLMIETREFVIPEIVRQVDLEFKRVKAKFGL